MKKKLLPMLKRVAITLFITIFLLEIGLRLVGYGSYQLPDFSMVSTPGAHLFPTEEMGVRLREGTYSVVINKHLKYQAIHSIKGQRTCGTPNSDSTEFEQNIAFYGCSFTYGTGVNDKEVYPYILQQQFSEYEIENHAVPGYGQAQVIIDLENNLDSENKPDVLVLNYLSFHNERNALNSSYQKKIRDGYAISKKMDIGIARYMCSYPFGVIENGSLKMKFLPIEEINSTLPLINYSAITNTVQGLLEEKGVDEKSDEKVTLAMIDRIHQLCKKHGIQLLVSTMTNDAITKRLIKQCNSASIPTVDIFVDLSQEEFTNAPYDQHPSAKAHKLFAEKLASYFSNIK